MGGLWREINDDWAWYRTIPGGGPLREPGFWVCAVHRLGARARRDRRPLLGSLMRALYVFCRFFILAATGVDLRSGVRLGRRFTIHTAQGIVIADGVTIGDDCMINTGVCIVHKANGKGEGVPTLGNGVRIGVGAKVMGAVTIGDRAVIGANAVVMRDVPPDTLAVGIPATIRQRND